MSLKNYIKKLLTLNLFLLLFYFFFPFIFSVDFSYIFHQFLGKIILFYEGAIKFKGEIGLMIALKDANFYIS